MFSTPFSYVSAVLWNSNLPLKFPLKVLRMNLKCFRLSRVTLDARLFT